MNELIIPSLEDPIWNLVSNLRIAVSHTVRYNIDSLEKDDFLSWARKIQERTGEKNPFVYREYKSVGCRAGHECTSEDDRTGCVTENIVSAVNGWEIPLAKVYEKKKQLRVILLASKEEFLKIISNVRVYIPSSRYLPEGGSTLQNFSFLENDKRGEKLNDPKYVEILLHCLAEQCLSLDASAKFSEESDIRKKEQKLFCVNFLKNTKNSLSSD